VDERFESDMRAGYPAEPPAVTLGSPMLDGEVLADVRVRLPAVDREPARARRRRDRHGQDEDRCSDRRPALGRRGAGVRRGRQGRPVRARAADRRRRPKVAERARPSGWTVEPARTPSSCSRCRRTLGAPVRATVESFGPVLLAKVLDLNETQTAVLTLVFRFCDDRDLPLLDLADLRTTLRFLASDEGKPVLEEYGGVSKAPSASCSGRSSRSRRRRRRVLRRARVRRADLLRPRTARGSSACSSSPT
jgi:hypothetical protein